MVKTPQHKGSPTIGLPCIWNELKLLRTILSLADFLCPLAKWECDVSHVQDEGTGNECVALLIFVVQDTPVFICIMGTWVSNA